MRSPYYVLPMIPLINQVLLPGGLLTVPMPRTKDVREVFKLHGQFAAFQVQDPAEGECYKIGCLARVVDIVVVDDDTVHVSLQGEARATCVSLMSLTYGYPFALIYCSKNDEQVPLFSHTLEEPMVQQMLEHLETAPLNNMQADTGSRQSAIVGILPFTNAERQFLLDNEDMHRRDDLMATWLHPMPSRCAH